MDFGVFMFPTDYAIRPDELAPDDEAARAIQQQATRVH